MRIDVYATPDSAREKDLKDRMVVVVDVLRATSTIITGLHNGCREFIPVIDIEEAVNIAKNYERDAFLLGGERNAQKIEGFHLSNSPREYTRDVVEGRTIIITTTNGTKAIRKASDAKEVIIAGFMNVNAVCDYIREIGEDTAMVCAGTDGRFSLEDILAVGAIISKLEDEIRLELDDLGMVCRYLYENNEDDLERILRGTYHYSRLVELGYEKDIEYCLKMNTAPIVPIYQDGVIRNIGNLRD